MAMTSAQFLATLPPDYQAKVRASIDPANYEAGLDAWFQAAVDAGDPGAVRAAGGQAVEGGGDDVGVVGGQGAPTSEWLGQRKPTPSELIRYYGETGKSEDFKRYSAAQVADWINRKWDVAGGHFTNDFGDVVEKPTESGPLSTAAGAATGEKGIPGGVTGAGGGVSAPVTEGTSGQISYTGNKLTDMLLDQFNSQRNLADPTKSNMFGFLAGRNPQDPNTPSTSKSGAFQDITGRLLGGGGLWWSPTDEWKSVTHTGVSPRVAAATPSAAVPATGGAANPAANPQPAAPTTTPTATASAASMPAGPSLPSAITPSPMQEMLSGKKKKGYFNFAAPASYFG